MYSRPIQGHADAQSKGLARIDPGAKTDPSEILHSGHQNPVFTGHHLPFNDGMPLQGVQRDFFIPIVSACFLPRPHPEDHPTRIRATPCPSGYSDHVYHSLPYYAGGCPNYTPPMILFVVQHLELISVLWSVLLPVGETSYAALQQ